MAFALPPLKVVVGATSTNFVSGIDQSIAKTREFQSELAKSRTGIDRFGERLSNLGDRMTKAGKSLSMKVTAPLMGIGLAAFKMASDMAESLSKTNVVFGAAASAVTAFASSAEANLGLAKQEALEAAASFGNMFNTIGLARSASAGMSTVMVQLAADMASFNNEDPSDMLLRLRSGLAGEAEPLRRFGVLLSESAVKAKALEMGLGGASGELSEAAKVQARYALILEQTTIQQGDFARTADGAANSIRIAQAELKNAAAVLGQDLLPAGTKVIQMVSDLVSRFSELDAGTRKVVVVTGALAAAAGPVLIVLGSLVGAAGTVIGAITTLGGVAAGLMGGLSTLAAGIGLVAEAFGAGGLSAAATGAVALLGGPVTVVIAAVGLAVAGLALAWKKDWGGIQEKTHSAVNAITSALDGLASKLRAPNVDQAAMGMLALGDASRQTAHAVMEVGAAAEEGFFNVGQAVKTGKAALTEISSAAEDAFFGIGTAVQTGTEALDVMGEAYKSLVKAASSSDVALTAARKSTETFGDVFPRIAEKAQALGVAITDLKPSLEGYMEAQKRVADASAQTWDRFLASTQQAIGNILSTEEGYNQKRQDIIQSANDRIAEIWTRAGEERAQKVAQIEEEIARAQAEGNDKRVAKLQQALQDELDTINTNAAQKEGAIRRDMDGQLQALDQGYEEQKAAQQKALAEMVLNQVDTWQLLGDITREQADEMRNAIVDQFGAMVDASALATGKIVGDLVDWKEQSGATAEDVVTDIVNINTIAKTLADEEAQRQEEWAANFEKRQEATASWAEKSMTKIGDVKAKLAEIGQAVTSIPSAKTITITTKYHATGKGVQLMSPKFVVTAAIEDLIDTAKQLKPILLQAKAEGMGDLVKTADALGRVFGALKSGIAALSSIQGAQVSGGIRLDVLDTLATFIDAVLGRVQILSRRFRLAGNFLDERLVKAVQATADTASRAMRLLSDTVKLLRDMLDLEKLADEAGVGDLQQLAASGTDLILGALSDAIAVVQTRFVNWAESDFVTRAIPQALTDMLKSWTGVLGAIAGGARDIRALIEAGQWTESYQEIEDSTQRGIANILTAMNAVLEDLRLGILSWSGDQVKAQTIDPAIAKMLKSWDDLLGALARGGNDIKKLVEFGEWQKSYQDIYEGIRRGIAKVLTAINAVLDDLRLGILTWSPDQVKSQTIDPAVTAMLKSWDDLLGALARSGNDIKKLIEFGEWKKSYQELDVGIRQGVAKVETAVNAVLNSLADGILSWSPAEAEARTIDPAIAKMLKSWNDVIGAISQSIGSIEKIFAYAEWSVDQTGIEEKVRQAANDLVAIAGDIASIWADANVQVTQEQADAAKNLNSVVGVLGSLVKLVQDAADIDVDAFNSTIRHKLVDALKDIALAVDDAVFGPDGLVAQKATILADLQAAATALKPLGGAVKSAVEAISAVVDLGKLGLEDVKSGNLTVQVDKFREYFEAGLSRLKDAIQKIAAKLVEISIDQAIGDGLAAAGDIKDALGDLASATQSILGAIKNVFEVGGLGSGTGEPSYARAIRNGISRIQGFLDRMVEVINGVTVPTVDLTWLVNMLDLLAGVASGGAPESSAAFDALEQAGQTLTTILQKIVDIASGAGMKDVDTTWLAELFKLLRSIIEQQDFADDAKKAIGTIGVGLQNAAQALPNDPSLILSLTQMRDDIRSFIDKQVVGGLGQFTATFGLSTKIDLANLSLPPASDYDTIRDRLQSEIATQITKLTALFPIEADFSSFDFKPEIDWTGVGNSLTSVITTQITKLVPNLPILADIASYDFKPELNWTNVQNQLTTTIETQITKLNPAFDLYAGIDTVDLPPHFQENLEYQIKEGLGTLSLSNLKSTVYIQITNLSGVAAGIATQITANYDEFLLLKSDISVTVKNLSSAALQIANDLEDAINAQLGGSLDLSAHIKSWEFSNLDYYGGVATQLLQDTLDIHLGKSIDLGRRALTMDFELNPFDALAGGVERLIGTLHTLRGELSALRQDLATLPGIGPGQVPAVAPAPATAVSEGIHYHAHLNVESSRLPEDLLTDFNILWGIAGA